MKHERKGQENPHHRQNIYMILLGITDPIHQIAFEKQLEFKKLPSFQHTLKWNNIFTTGNLFYASFHMLLCFLSRDKSKAEIQYKTIHETPWKRINSLPTSIERTLFQTNKSDICVGCYVILDTLGPDCAVNWIQGRATKIRWYLSIITVAESREMF